MKLLFFDSFVLGAVVDDRVVDLSGHVGAGPHVEPQALLRGVIEQWDEVGPRLAEVARSASGVPLSSVRVRPPVPRPVNVDCMAVNYDDQVVQTTPPINAFHKSPSSIIGDGDTMVLPDVPATIFEGEAELAVVIGKRATNVPSGEAMDHVFGYMNFIDGSARGLPPANSFFPMKSRDTFCPIGPFLVTADEIPDPENRRVRLWNNGTLMQDFGTDRMISKIARCIEFISSTHTLEPGDVLATGTNHDGLHAFMDGDQVEMEIAGLGRLHVSVRDDLKRTWSRDTRLERLRAGQQGTAPQLDGTYSGTAETT